MKILLVGVCPLFYQLERAYVTHRNELIIPAVFCKKFKFKLPSGHRFCGLSIRDQQVFARVKEIRS